MTPAGEPANRRAGTRAAVERPSTLRTADARPLDVMVEDLSTAGFRFSSPMPIATGTPIRVGLAGAGRADARVAWHQGERHGCLFTPPLSRAQIDAAFTHPPDARATVTLAPGDHIPARLRPRIALPLRFALMGLAGSLGWAGLALALRGLHPS